MMSHRSRVFLNASEIIGLVVWHNHRKHASEIKYINIVFCGRTEVLLSIKHLDRAANCAVRLHGGTQYQGGRYFYFRYRPMKTRDLLAPLVATATVVASRQP